MSEVLKDKIAIVTGAAGTMGLAATRFLLGAMDFNQERRRRSSACRGAFHHR